MDFTLRWSIVDANFIGGGGGDLSETQTNTSVIRYFERVITEHQIVGVLNWCLYPPFYLAWHFTTYLQLWRYAIFVHCYHRVLSLFCIYGRYFYSIQTGLQMHKFIKIFLDWQYHWLCFCQDITLCTHCPLSCCSPSRSSVVLQ